MTQEQTKLTASSGWDLKNFFLLHLAAAAIIITFLLPSTARGWELVDISFFKAVNGSLEGNPRWQLFWALANHKLMDWVGDVVMVFLFLFYVYKGEKGQRTERVVHFLFCTIYIAALIFFVNRILFREQLCIPRDSPTLVLDQAVLLSERIPWLGIKDVSTKSFPGDHATTAIVFACSYTYFAGRRLGFFAWAYAFFVSFPRLIVGAHWLTDILVGSVSITCLSFAWFFFTPLKNLIISVFQELCGDFLRLKSRLLIPK